MKFSINRLYAFIAFCIIFNLACDDDDYPTQTNDSNAELVYCLDMINTVEGGAFDYADNNTMTKE